MEQDFFKNNQPPQPDDLIIGDMLAQTQPHPCTQPIYTAEDSEDCLYINVFTPDSKAVPLIPVYVYIYGGIYYTGAASDYTPEFMLDENVLLVVINYRIGVLGFISTGDSVVPGNMGFKDIRCALRWIKDNIWRFGGDSKKVTIGGNSSGGSAVQTLMIFLEQEGLFRSGISESGSALTTYNFVPPQQVRWINYQISNFTRCPTDSIAFINCLKAKPAKDFVDLYNQLLDNQNTHNPLGVFRVLADFPIFGAVLEPPCVKDRFITGNPWNYNSSLPYLIGCTSKEYLTSVFTKLDGHSPGNYTLFDAGFNIGLPRFLKYQFSSADGSLVPIAIRNFYMRNESFSRHNLADIADAISDAIILYPSFEAASRSESSNTFLYFFDHIGPRSFVPIPPDDRIGSIHVDELYFFFPYRSGIFVRNVTAADIQLSKTLVKFWVNFMTYNDPTPDSVEGVKWPPFHSQNSYLYIKRNGMQTMEHEFFPKRMQFWRSQPYPFRDEIYGEVPC